MCGLAAPPEPALTTLALAISDLARKYRLYGLKQCQTVVLHFCSGEVLPSGTLERRGARQS